MLQINPGPVLRRDRDGLSRRSFLTVGALGGTGLTLASWLRCQALAAATGRPVRKTAVILFWLDGGLSHIDSYDMKPEAPIEFRGPLKPIRTNVPGIDICELLPRLAASMDKLAIVRSLRHVINSHEEAAHWMLTGYFALPRGSNLDSTNPAVGAVTAKVRGSNQPGLPPYVAVPVAFTAGHRPGYHAAAYLGSAYNPFVTVDDPSNPDFSVRNLKLPNSLTFGQLQDRRKLLREFDLIRRDLDRSGSLESIDRFQRDACEVIASAATREAFDMSREPSKVRDRYGRSTWGQSALLARRLVEAGVTYVTVNMSGWDNHQRIFPWLHQRLPLMDQTIAALVQDLSDRGLYDRVLVCAYGDFGRTPRVNENAGRDHWAQAGFALLGGGGLKRGQVVGSTTSKGEEPRDRPLDPADLLATVYKVLDIDTTRQFTDRSGRPHPILNGGKPIEELC